MEIPVPHFVYPAAWGFSLKYPFRGYKVLTNVHLKQQCAESHLRSYKVTWKPSVSCCFSKVNCLWRRKPIWASAFSCRWGIHKSLLLAGGWPKRLPPLRGLKKFSLVLLQNQHLLLPRNFNPPWRVRQEEKPVLSDSEANKANRRDLLPDWSIFPRCFHQTMLAWGKLSACLYVLLFSLERLKQLTK